MYLIKLELTPTLEFLLLDCTLIDYSTSVLLQLIRPPPQDCCCPDVIWVVVHSQHSSDMVVCGAGVAVSFQEIEISVNDHILSDHVLLSFLNRKTHLEKD